MTLGKKLPKLLKLSLELLDGLGRIRESQVLTVIETCTLGPVVRTVDHQRVIDNGEFVMHVGRAIQRSDGEQKC